MPSASSIAAMMSSAVAMAAFEATLQAQVAVAFFIPGLVYLADAIGTGQSSKPSDGLRAAFPKDAPKDMAAEQQSVTAGNASSLNDGAAALVLVSGDKLKALNLKPLARLVAYGHAGVEPAYMGIGPVPATRQALQRAESHKAQLEKMLADPARAGQQFSRIGHGDRQA